MNAFREKDRHFFELSNVVYDKEGNGYKWEDLVLCPLEDEKVNYRMSQERIEGLREKYAGMAMQAIISDHKGMSNIQNALENSGTDRDNTLQRVVAEQAVNFADALIEELRKEV